MEKTGPNKLIPILNLNKTPALTANTYQLEPA